MRPKPIAGHRLTRLLIASVTGVALLVVAPRVVVPAAVAQQLMAPDPLAAKAAALFAYEDGTWESRWEVLDDEGNVVQEMSGTETFSYTMDGKAVLLETHTEGSSSFSHATRFYNPHEKKIVFVSISTEGDYWIMKQDAETEVVQSEPKLLPDGRTAIIRFTIVEKTEDEQDVVMEASTDGGKTWALRTRQYLRRVKP